MKTGIILFILFILILSSFSGSIFAQTNAVDLSFNPVLSKDAAGTSFILQPDGKIIILGGFQVVNNIIKNQIVRLNPDGSLDNSFDCTSCDFNIGSALVQADGKIIIAGSIYSTVTQSSAAQNPGSHKR